MARSKGSTRNVNSELDSGLTAAEDDELRQLTWFSMVGQLSESSSERILELRAKDRRTKVRNPRPDPSASRTISDAAVPPPKLDSGPQSAPGQFTCPNCGFVQRALPPAQSANR
ncbi:MAG TPA: hypothetical protein VFV02_02560 [Acidimicrobiales bacterium]|nr:hypothetical protein [Acidimicrobiales bacterium]